MNNNPLVSIALCVYNGEQYLEQQLITLLNQTYVHLEIVIVDDVSSDNSSAIIEKYLTDQRIKFYKNEKNLGYVKNFEKAMGYCTGDFIALADQDDIWDLNKIELMVKQIGDAVLIYHDSEFINDDGDSLGKMSDVINMYAGASPLSFLFYNCISGHSCLLKKDLVSRLGPLNPRFNHDWWIAFVAGNSGKIKYIDQTLVKYRQHLLSATDILKLKDSPKKFNSKYGELNQEWLRYCETFRGKYYHLIRSIDYLHDNPGIVNSIKLFFLLMRHYRELFFIKKKSGISKLNYARKMGFFNPKTYTPVLS